MRSDREAGVTRLVIPPNLARPLPDELLYSLIARSAVHVGHWSPKQLLGALYSARGTLAIPDLPSSLVRLARVAGAWGLTVEQLAYRHTLLPYYSHFMHPGERARVLEAMLDRRAHLHVRLGICAGAVARTAFFRLCPVCTKEDVANYGETFWRRMHHLPGVVVCAAHGDMLVETKVPFRPIGRHEHIGAHPRLLATAVPLMPNLSADESALAIARRSSALLGPAEPVPVTDYRALLRQFGFVGRRGGSARLKAVVGAAIPASLLRVMFPSLGPEELPGWLDVARRKPRRALHPLKHVVLQVVLEGVAKTQAAEATKAGSKAEMLSTAKTRAPDLRQKALSLASEGRSTWAIARELGIAWETADRLLKPPTPKPLTSAPDLQVTTDRAAWTALRTASPAATRTELRRSAPALYARLYRADRAWLLEQSCPRYPRAPVTRIDWDGRDRELVERVAAVIDGIRSRVPEVRASRCRVLGELQVRSLLALRGAKLPRTRALLAQRCETAQDFQLRRLERVLTEKPAESRLLADWALLRVARINPGRLADGGAALLEAARRRCA